MTWRAERPIIWGLGAHVVKTGLSPLVIDLMRRGFVSALATNGAGLIHDFEIAVAGASLAATLPDPAAVTSEVPGAGAPTAKPLVRARRSLVDGALHVFLRNAGDTAALAPRLRIGSVTTPPVPLLRRSARYLLAGARTRGWSRPPTW